ncbi:MAG: TIGR01777 family oxidoreductase [Bacillota bacterium]
MKILITGATGLIGKEVGKALAEKGHEIFVVSRSLAKAREVLPFPCQVIVGDLMKSSLNDKSLQQIEAVINLMGEPVVGDRWTSEKKKSIYDSRVLGTKHLVESLSSSVKIFIQGSAIGYYGDRGDEVLTEESTPGHDFLARVVVDWEAAAAKAPGRKVYIRTSVVLAPYGGALQEMLFPFRAGVGGPLGNGQHWMPWIHIKDITDLFVFAFEKDHVEGVINGASPQPVRNKEFSQALAKSLGRSMGPAVPPVALKVIFGEAGTVVLSSTRSSAEKAQKLGYQFHYSDIHMTLHELCASYRANEDIFYAEQFVDKSPEELFAFFRDPYNLEQITPPTLNFHIKKISGTEIKQGTLIDYSLKIHGVPAVWKTEIDEWNPPYRFVDNQKVGPYNLWHHTHEFRPYLGGTLMVDRVRYRLPMGYLGWLVGSHFVRKDIENIFSFRRKFIAHIDAPRKG